MATPIVDRSAQYAHPLDHFVLTESMFDIWREAFRERGEAAANGLCLANREVALVVRHGVSLIIDKLARAATSPLKADHWKDVMGYANTILRGVAAFAMRNGSTDELIELDADWAAIVEAEAGPRAEKL